MIVDLIRNDIGRICKFGSVSVEKLCDLETHPTLFHLVSTVEGELRENLRFFDIIKAVFPCGSITGAPKIRTMQLIEELETAPRGLSMGAIGYSIPNSRFQIPNSKFKIPDAETHNSRLSTFHYFDLSVAIRTMVIRENEAVFNVGGGIVIDSDPQAEYEETLTKARALLNALNAADWAENQVD
jgi:para-aminobenzoate synthetase component 1